MNDIKGHTALGSQEMLRILILEDDPIHAEFIQYALTTNDCSCEIVWTTTRSGFLTALQQHFFDVILADYVLPDFDGLRALALVQALCSGVPFILVSGMMREELVVEALKSGATDYVSKLHFSRLPHVVRRVVREARERSVRQQAEQALVQSEQRW